MVCVCWVCFVLLQVLLIADELLSSGVLTGAALLLADTAECIYSQGQLDDLPQQVYLCYGSVEGGGEGVVTM